MLSRLHAHALGVPSLAHRHGFSPFPLLSHGKIAFECHGAQLPLFILHTRTPFLHGRAISTARSSPLHKLQKEVEVPTPLVFESSSTNPYHNLSIEDHLLRNSHPSSQILFLYTNRPCVVIGRNQNPWLECNLELLRNGLPADGADIENGATKYKSKHEAVPIDLVRRRSGGGTVFHDLGNLNYSVMVPNVKEFNRRKHAEMVVRALNKVTDYDFSASIKVNDRHDIVMQKRGHEEWLKISGSAFKLTKGRALHHGTLLYSSAHLHRISGLLRSPARGYIHAKGVESVRSRVGNLSWIDNRGERESLRTAIIDKVVREFLSLYGDDTASLQTEPAVRVGDEDCQEQTNASIAAGVRELMTQEWRFDQTPRFDFHSRMVDGIELRFHANHGVIEDLSIHNSTSEGTQSSQGVVRGQKHLHDVKDWKALLSNLEGGANDTTQQQRILRKLSQKVTKNEDLMHRIERSFPCFT